MTSFPTLCKCSACLKVGGVVWEFVRSGVGRWLCPASNEVVVLNLTEIDRADRMRLAGYS